MRPFSYVTYDAAGARARGMILADTEADAAAQLKNRGLFVSELSAARSGPSSSWRTHLSQRRTTRLSRDLQAVFTRQMAVLLGADLPVEAALEAVRSSGDSTPLTALATRTKAEVLDGQPLAEALERAGAGFPAYVIAAIHAGESSGALAPVFEELAEHLETLGNEKAEIVSALVYPGFVAAVSFLVCAILMVNVAPEIVAMFEISGQPLPPLTQNMLAVSDWMRANATLLGVLLAGGVVLNLLSSRLPRLRALRDRFFVRLPLVGRLMRRSAAVQYLRTLALVLASRQTVPVATENAARVLSVAQFNREGQAVQTALQAGSTLSDALTELSIIPPCGAPVDCRWGNVRPFGPHGRAQRAAGGNRSGQRAQTHCRAFGAHADDVGGQLCAFGALADL